MAHEDLSHSALSNNSSKVLEEGIYTISETWEITGNNHVTIIGETNASGQPLTTIRLAGASTNNQATASGVYIITAQDNNSPFLYDFPILYKDGEYCEMQASPIITISSNSWSSGLYDDGSTASAYIAAPTLNSLVKKGSLLVFYHTFKTYKFFVKEIISVNTEVRFLLVAKAADDAATTTIPATNIISNFLSDIRQSPDVKMRVYNPNVLENNIEEGKYIFENSQNENTIIKYKNSSVVGSPSFTVMNEETLLQVSSSSYITFKNIRFTGNAIFDPTICQDQAEFNAPSAITIGRSCSYVKFENCIFEHLHGYCIGVGDHATQYAPSNDPKVTDNDCDISHITIQDCLFSNIHGGAIHLANSHDGAITGNSITNYGKLLTSSCAILVRSGHNISIDNNDISDGYYTGISVGWDWDYTRQGQCHDITVSHNTITNVLKSAPYQDGANTHTGVLLYDGGAIYTLGISPGTVITKNLIHDVCQGHKSNGEYFFIGPHDMRWNFAGIYLDEASTFIQVYENILYNNPVNVHIHHGNGLELYDNLFAYPTICNLTANFNYSYFPVKNENDFPKHPDKTGDKPKIIEEDVLFFSYRNIFIQEEGRVFRIPFRDKCYFTADLFDVYGNNVHRGSLTNITSDTEHACGCFEKNIHGLLFNYSEGKWTLKETAQINANAQPYHITAYESVCSQYFHDNSEMNRIKVSTPYWQSKLCFLVMVRQNTTMMLDTSFHYLRGYNGFNDDVPESDWNHPPHTDNLISLLPNTEYIIRINHFYDGYVTFGDITKLKVIDTTIVRQIHEFNQSGNYFEYAYLSCHDLHKLRYVEQLMARYNLRDLADSSLVSLAHFKQLGLLLLGGSCSDYDTVKYDVTADWHIRRLFIPNDIMAQIAVLNIGVRYVPHNIGALRVCSELHLSSSPIWKYVADKVEVRDGNGTIVAFRQEYTPAPISTAYLSANPYFEEYIDLKDAFQEACQENESITI